MIPKNKTISVLHPYLDKKWWAVRMMIYLSNLLVQEWNNVTFYTFSHDEKLFSKELNFNVVVWNKLNIAKKIRKSDYIIIWNSPMQFVWVISKILFLSKAKLFWRHHHYPWYYNENTNFLLLIKRYLEKFSVKFVDEIIVNSKYLQDIIEDIYKRKSKVLYPVLDKAFLQSTKTHWEKKIIFTYSRWVKWKNIEQIFETYSYLRRNNINYQLIVWGEWEELNSYKEKFKTDKKISFLWLLDNSSIVLNLKQSSILLFPSKIDSFWLTIIEAMSFGVPVIAFDLNWAKEIINNWENGFLVKTSKDFNEKTKELLLNEPLLKKFSDNSIIVSSKFSEKNFKKTLKEIF